MHYFTQLLVIGTAITGAFAQYNDGYETVNLPTDPVQIRLAYQGPKAMMVSWNTFGQLTNPSVAYGTDPTNLNLVATSSVSVTYPTSLTYNNHVNITGLMSYTTYYYLPQFSNATAPYSFTTARAAGDMTPYTVGVVIDMGTFGALGLSSSIPAADNPLGPTEQTTIAAMVEKINDYDFIMHPGDYAYADAWAKEEAAGVIPSGPALAQYTVVYESILNAFFDELEPLTSAKPYMVNPGNHETNCDNLGTKACTIGQTNFTGYQNHWRMPSNPSNGVGNMWYSYDYGMAHFVHLTTETDLGNGLVAPDGAFGGPFGSTTNAQIDWLTNDLASVNRTRTPWIIVTGHRPLYISGTICVPCVTAFETLFYTYNVDIYINGHSHLYDRTLPVYQNVIDPNGYNNPRAPMYLTNGAGGHFAGLDSAPSALQPYTAYNTVQGYAWSTLDFINSTHMVINGLWSINNTVFDSVTLYKAHNVVSSPSSSSSSSIVSTSSSVSTSLSSTIILSTSFQLSSTSSLSSLSSTIPTTTIQSTSTGTSTISSSANLPSYTNFNGAGHLYVYVNGSLMGDIGSSGAWYFFPGQGIATWTASPATATPNGFTISKSGYCYIDSTQAFNCGGTLAQAQVFTQDAEGDLLYNGSPAFYAPSLANIGAKPTVYATPLPVSMNIVWGNLVATPLAYTGPSTSGVLSTSSSIASTSTSSVITGSSISSLLSTSSSVLSSTSTAGPITGSSSSTVLSSFTVSVQTSSSSSSSRLVSSSSSSSVLSSSSSAPSSNALSSSSTLLSSSSTLGSSFSSVLSSSSSIPSSTSNALPSSSSLLSSSSSSGLLSPSSPSSCAASTITLSASVSVVTVTISTEVDFTMPASTVYFTSSQPGSTIYLTNTSTVYITYSDYITQPASTIYITNIHAITEPLTLPASTIYLTEIDTIQASTVYVTNTDDITLPASTVYLTPSASTVTISVTTTASCLASTDDITLLASTVFVTSIDDITLPASTVYLTPSVSFITVSASASTLTVIASASCLASTDDITLPASTVYLTPSASTITISASASTLTVTASASCLASTVEIISTLDVPTTIIDISTVLAPTTIVASLSTPFKPSTASTTSTKATATTSVSVQPAPTTCKLDNCFRGIRAKGAVAAAFCSQYLMTPSLPTPTYASKCTVASRVSSACYCAITA